ncbi:MAG: YbbR-like domain-containing protein, partial [Bacillota bacterium]|nr:YbbR-like domain-containing protein [Bacillota bacterium]
MKKFQEMLFKDIGWKLLSIAIATILWFMVINIDQPVDTRSYTRPLSLQNIEVLTDRQMTVGNLEELRATKVTIKVKAQRTALDRLSQNPEWLQASVDFSQLNHASIGDTISLPIDVSVQGGNTYGISSKSPGTVEIVIEPLSQKEFPIELIMTGVLPEDVYLSEPTLSQNTVWVSGPASTIQ